MQLKFTFLTAVAILATTTLAAPSAEAQNAKVPCDLQPQHPCQLYTRFPACEKTWNELLTLCQTSGCIKWVKDPKADCKKKP